jgi:hypothetical protein
MEQRRQPALAPATLLRGFVSHGLAGLPIALASKRFDG